MKSRYADARANDNRTTVIQEVTTCFSIPSIIFISETRIETLVDSRPIEFVVIG